jgi:hypothetical protein
VSAATGTLRTGSNATAAAWKFLQRIPAGPAVTLNDAGEEVAVCYFVIFSRNVV